jgi:hypothetical protein
MRKAGPLHRIGVVQGSMPMSMSSAFVSFAMKHEPLSVSHSWLRKGVDETEAVLDSRDDKALNVLALDAFSGGDMGDGLAITAIESEGNADLLLVVASDFEAV